MSKSLVFTDDFSKEEVYEIFKLADKFADDISQVKPLEGKIILFPPEALDKKEKPEDVIGYLENWVEAIVVRHSDIEVVKSMVNHVRLVIGI